MDHASHGRLRGCGSSYQGERIDGRHGTHHALERCAVPGTGQAAGEISGLDMLERTVNAVHTGVSCALDQPVAFFLDSRRVVAPGGRSALQVWQGLEWQPSTSRFHLCFRWWCDPYIRLFEKRSLEEGLSAVSNCHSQSQSLSQDQQHTQRGRLWCRTVKVLLSRQLLLIPSGRKSRFGCVVVVFVHPAY